MSHEPPCSTMLVFLFRMWDGEMATLRRIHKHAINYIISMVEWQIVIMGSNHTHISLMTEHGTALYSIMNSTPPPCSHHCTHPALFSTSHTICITNFWYSDELHARVYTAAAQTANRLRNCTYSVSMSTYWSQLSITVTYLWHLPVNNTVYLQFWLDVYCRFIGFVSG